VRVFADGRGGPFTIVRQSGASSIFPWRVCEVFADVRGGGVFLRSYGSQLLALCSSGRFIRVFMDARGEGLFVTVRKASDRSVTVHHKRKVVRCQLYSPGEFVRVFTDVRGEGLISIVRQSSASSCSSGGSVKCSQMSEGGLVIV
jgi:hypothetical protein